MPSSARWPASRRPPASVLADAEQALARGDPDSTGIRRADLFYEHVHLTFDGNYLLARAVFDQVCAALPQLAAHRQARQSRRGSDARNCWH